MLKKYEKYIYVLASLCLQGLQVFSGTFYLFLEDILSVYIVLEALLYIFIYLIYIYISL